MGRFDGKVVFVAGGNSGIGQASALRLAEEGAKVVIAGRNPDTGAETVAMLEERGADAHFVQMNIRSLEDVQKAIAFTVETFGQLNYLVNSAGLEGKVANTVECSEENWHAVIDTNVNGTWYLMKSAIPHMLESGGGAIVNVASVIGVIAFPGLPAYTASKAGMVGLSKTTALEYATEGIRVNVVAPGSIRTPMYERFSGGTPEAEAYMAGFHPLGRIGEPNEVAGAVTYLLSDDASFVTGHVMPVAGGWEVP